MPHNKGHRDSTQTTAILAANNRKIPLHTPTQPAQAPHGRPVWTSAETDERGPCECVHRRTPQPTGAPSRTAVSACEEEENQDKVGSKITNGATAAGQQGRQEGRGPKYSEKQQECTIIECRAGRARPASIPNGHPKNGRRRLRRKWRAPVVRHPARLQTTGKASRATPARQGPMLK